MTRVGTPTLDGGGNPYLTLLYTAVQDRGASVRTVDVRPWRLARAPRYDVLHIHWPEHIMVGPATGLIRSAKATAAPIALRSSLLALKRRGVRIVWTAHNIGPHDPEANHLQVGLYRWLARGADSVIVHTSYAGRLVRERHGRTGPMYLARHGNYMGVYPKPRAERNVLRAKYGFDDSHRVLLAFGQIRAPKRLIELATEFERYSPASTRLIIAGAAKDPDITRRLKVVTDASDRIVLLDRYIPDPEVGELYALADLAVFNYAEIFSSGALLLALSLGCAVLAPRRGAAEEAFESPALFMWETSPLEVLSAALAVSADIRGRAALAAAESHTWVDSARVHMRAYEGSPPDQ